MNPGETKSNDAISEVSAWVLRGGVVCSSGVMLAGILLSFWHGRMSVQRITTDTFDYQPAAIWTQIIHWQGKGIIEAGIYLLLFTPIMRVFASMLLFAFHEKDWLYTAITVGVLLLTLAGLLWIG